MFQIVSAYILGTAQKRLQFNKTYRIHNILSHIFTKKIPFSNHNKV